MADTGIVDRDGFQLEWVREGHGTPMLVLGSQRFYRRYFPPALRDHFEVVFCDLRQWAPTPDGFDVTTITNDTFNEDIDAIREAVGLDRPIVVGQSQHGAHALVYAMRFPEHVRGVVPIAANPPAGSREGLESSEAFWNRDASPERRAADRNNQDTRRVPTSIETPQDMIDSYVANGATVWYDPTFDCTLLWDDVAINLEVEDQVFAPEVLGDYHLQPLDVPVFLALGRYDYLVPYYVWDEPKKNFTNLRHRLYEKSAHQPPYEEPDEFTSDLVEWSKGL